MPETKVCPVCNGKGVFDALVSQHDDSTKWVKCYNCDGSGVIYQMTEEEERDYHDDYW